MPPVNITWSVEKPVLSGGKNLRFVIWTGEWLKPALSGTNSEPWLMRENCAARKTACNSNRSNVKNILLSGYQN
jgi:hypothetical protein